MTTTPDRWRNRIKRRGSANPASLKANPLNWRTHPPAQRDALIELLDTVGWVQQIIVNETTGHVLDGHLRVDIAIERGEKSVPVGYVELTEDEERLVLATLDTITGMAEVDTDTLDALLATISPDSGSAIDAMLAELSGRGVAVPTGGFPSGLNAAPQLQGLEYRVIIECDDEEQQRALIERFEEEGLTCRALTS